MYLLHFRSFPTFGLHQISITSFFFLLFVLFGNDSRISYLSNSISRCFKKLRYITTLTSRAGLVDLWISFVNMYKFIVLKDVCSVHAT